MLVLLLVVLLLAGGCASRANIEAANLAAGPPPAEPPSTPRADVAAPRHQADRLFFLDKNAGWAVLGDDLYHTTDGGKSWAVLNPGAGGGRDIRSLIFVNARDGWAVRDEWGHGRRANFLLRTQDGGRTWREVMKVGSPIYNIDFLNARFGCVRARWEPLQCTSDGGATWEEVLFEDKPPGLFEGLHAVYFIDEKRGWAYGAGIWRTDDGGLTWAEAVPGDTFKGELYSAAFIDGKTGWMVGSQRQVWRTQDGQTWQPAAVPPATSKAGATTGEPPGNLYGVFFIDRREGWLAAADETLLHSTDGGATWQVISRWPGGIRALRFMSRSEGWAVDEANNLLRTTDGGVSWRVQRLD